MRRAVHSARQLCPSGGIFGGRAAPHRCSSKLSVARVATLVDSSSTAAVAAAASGFVDMSSTPAPMSRGGEDQNRQEWDDGSKVHVYMSSNRDGDVFQLDAHGAGCSCAAALLHGGCCTRRARCTAMGLPPEVCKHVIRLDLLQARPGSAARAVCSTQRPRSRWTSAGHVWTSGSTLGLK